MFKKWGVSFLLCCGLVATLLVAAMPSLSALEIKWHTDYNQALTVAKQESKPVVLLFTGSDWCPGCKYLEKKILDTKEFADQAGNRFVFVKLDFPRRAKQDAKIQEQNEKLQDQYKIEYYPTVVLLDSEGKLIGEVDRSNNSGNPAKYAAQMVEQAKK